MRIIDVHTHPVFFTKGRQKSELRKLVAHGKSHGVKRMIVLGDVLNYGGTPNEEQLRLINDETGGIQRMFPNYFVGFCYLNPNLGEKAVMEEVTRCVTNYGSKGIKLEIANSADEPCMRHIAKACREFNIPVLQHSWSNTNFRPGMDSHSDPDDTALFAQRNPDVNIIMAHLVGIGYRGVIAAKGLDNIYVDISGAFPEDGLIEYAVEHLGSDHVLYGTDIPIRQSAVKIGAVLGAKLTNADRQKIFFDNTAKLLNLN
jgi:uncharacterized protein